MYPHYLVFDAFEGCDEVPFAKTIRETGAVEMTKVKMTSSFTAFALDRLKEPVEK